MKKIHKDPNAKTSFENKKKYNRKKVKFYKDKGTIFIDRGKGFHKRIDGVWHLQ